MGDTSSLKTDTKKVTTLGVVGLVNDILSFTR